MRDKLRDEKYFKEHLEWLETSIGKFKDLEIKTETEGSYNFTLYKKSLNKFYCNYSLGKPIECLKCDFEEIFNYFYFRNKKAVYSTILEMLSLSILLNMDKSYFEKISEVLEGSKIEDPLFSLMLSYKIEYNYKSAKKSKFYKKLYSILQKEEASIDDIKNYLRYYYNSNQNSGWYDSHKFDDRGYVGYWSMEIGAIAKLLNIDDEVLQDAKYYPYDLVKFTK